MNIPSLATAPKVARGRYSAAESLQSCRRIGGRGDEGATFQAHQVQQCRRVMKAVILQTITTVCTSAACTTPPQAGTVRRRTVAQARCCAASTPCLAMTSLFNSTTRHLSNSIAIVFGACMCQFDRQPPSPMLGTRSRETLRKRNPTCDPKAVVKEATQVCRTFSALT